MRLLNLKKLLEKTMIYIEAIEDLASSHGAGDRTMDPELAKDIEDYLSGKARSTLPWEKVTEETEFRNGCEYFICYTAGTSFSYAHIEQNGDDLVFYDTEKPVDKKLITDYFEITPPEDSE